MCWCHLFVLIITSIVKRMTVFFLSKKETWYLSCQKRKGHTAGRTLVRSKNNNEAPIILQKTSKRSRRLYWQKKTLYMFVYRYLLLCLERQSQVTTLATLPWPPLGKERWRGSRHVHVARGASSWCCSSACCSLRLSMAQGVRRSPRRLRTSSQLKVFLSSLAPRLCCIEISFFSCCFIGFEKRKMLCMKAFAVLLNRFWGKRNLAAIKLLHAPDAQESPRDSSFETGRVLRRIAAGLGVPRCNWNLTAGPCDSKRDEMNCVRYDCSFSNGTACHVTEIYLKGQNFSGELPPDFADFPNLLQLHLSRNLFHGGVPAQWARMKLQGLVLNGNRLSGPFPMVLTNITTLTDLEIEGNEFHGSIPPEIGRLIRMEKLWVYLYYDAQIEDMVICRVWSIKYLDRKISLINM